MSWSHLNLFVGSDLFYDTTIYFLYIAFGFFLIPMEHNFMEKKNMVEPGSGGTKEEWQSSGMR